MNDILITKIEQSATAVVLVPSRVVKKDNLQNLGDYRLRLACGLKATDALQVFIQTDSGNVPILCKYGNMVFSNQLKTRKYYNIGYGNTNTDYANGQFVIFNCICPGSISVS